jgi:hypothetical protein
VLPAAAAGPAPAVAYVGVFGRYNNFYQPAFIFPKQLGPDYAKYIWDAASHEIGKCQVFVVHSRC